MKILVATRNRGKLREINSLLPDVELLTFDDVDFRWKIKEVGKTFCENALIKARFSHDILNMPVIGEDSGIVVPALGDAPGVYSARFAGENATDEENNRKLLKLVSQLPQEDRKAYYFSCVAFCYGNRCYTFTGRVDGEITLEPRGDGGFGYDPLFFLPHLNRTMAELDPDEKNRISHRGEALRKFKEFFEKLRNESG